MFDMLKVIFYVLVVLGTDNYFTLGFERRCFDCVSITSCESGLKFAENAKVLENQLGFLPRESRQLFNNAICGTDVYDPNLPKVCCSDFPRLDVRFNNDVSSLTTEKTAERAIEETITAANEEVTIIPGKDEIEMHRNLRLLPNNMCGGIDGSRIVGGRVPMLYELPWMALIAYNIRGREQFRCGGSIINSRYILTAAHCVMKDGKLKTNIASVRIGEFDYSTSMDCQGEYDICESFIQDIDIEEIIPHEDFTGRVPQQADIALLRLNETITFRSNIAPICLPVFSTLRRNRLGGKNATVAGWGTTENETTSSKLLKVTIPILNDDVCGSYYRRLSQNLLEKSFCAGELKKDSCGGDSGGPLIIESDFGDLIRMVQFGIVSFGPRQCGTEFPGVYTDVTKYMDWILDNIRE